MKNFILKALIIILLFGIETKISNAQYTTPYKKQIKYLLNDSTDNTRDFKFKFEGKNKIFYDVNFSTNDSNNWKVIIMQDTILINKFSYPFDVIHQIGLVKPGNSEQTCILVVSATGGNGITTNEFTFINPDFDSIMNVQINYIEQYNNTTFDYNKASLNPYRLDEIKFLVGLIGEYSLIPYKKYRQKKY